MDTQKQTRVKKVKQPKQRKELTQAEANLVLEIFRDVSHNIQEWQHQARSLNKEIYNKVDKADPSTTPLFKDMNRLRNKIRHIKEANKKVSSIIHKLKTQR